MDSIPSILRAFWEEGFFKEIRTHADIMTHINEQDVNCAPDSLRKALNRASFLITRRSKTGTAYIQRKPAISRSVETASADLFDNALVSKLDKSFETEITDLHLNFGRSGTCTAFLLRKILEKLIYRCFAKQGMERRLFDAKNPDRLIGLEAMINMSSQEKVGGVPFLTSPTAQAVKGIKFLGDVSAHNPLVNVDMKDIILQMPYIVTAYRELATKL